MSYFTKSKLYILLIVVLVLLNVSLILFFWKGPPSKSGRWAQQGGSRGQARLEFFVARKLDFSTEQKEEYSRLREAHFQVAGREFRRMRRLRRRLFNMVGEDNDMGKRQRLLQEIGKTQSTVDSLTFIHFQNLRDICDEGQKLKFDKVMDEVVHRLDRQGLRRGRKGG